MLKPNPLSLSEKYAINRSGELGRQVDALDPETWTLHTPVLPCSYTDCAIAYRILKNKYPEEAFEHKWHDYPLSSGLHLAPYHNVKKPWPWQKAAQTSGPLFARAAAREDAEIQALVDEIDENDEAAALEGDAILETDEAFNVTKTIACLKRRYPDDNFRYELVKSTGPDAVPPYYRYYVRSVGGSNG